MRRSAYDGKAPEALQSLSVGGMLAQSLATGATQRFPQVLESGAAWQGQVEEEEERKGKVQVVVAGTLLSVPEKKHRRGRGGEEEERKMGADVDSLLCLSRFTPVQPVF